MYVHGCIFIRLIYNSCVCIANKENLKAMVNVDLKQIKSKYDKKLFQDEFTSWFQTIQENTTQSNVGFVSSMCKLPWVIWKMYISLAYQYRSLNQY